ncbi:SnoaL-like domain-containing protein [Rhizobiales bacterium GAS113]|nr:SnoaL-like domain-containing protein [Rhizobiales bacterium GAS113]SED72678.1 SnoaL-like domain-containing protein [Rhizobiales bacterium GAS188]
MRSMQTHNGVSSIEVAPATSERGFNPGATQEFFDRQEIMELVRLERFWRDQCKWDRLAAAYTEDSEVCTTWFRGTGAEFAAASREMYQVRGARGKHMIWPASVRINGDRAICESPGTIYSRSIFNGVEVDLMNYARFHSLVVRTNAGWRLKTFTGIYQKDTMTPVNSTESLPVDWDELKTFRTSYRFLSYSLMQRGYVVPQDLPGDDRPDIVNAHCAKADRWLETGEAPFPQRS